MHPMDTGSFGWVTVATGKWGRKDMASSVETHKCNLIFSLSSLDCDADSNSDAGR